MEEYERDGKIYFENYYGAYHIVILNKLSKEIIFYGDNAGNCCLYFSKGGKFISDSLLELKEPLSTTTPNYKAIVQFINFNCIYSDDTIANEISRTMPNIFYLFKDNVLTKIPKYEFKLEKFDRYNNLNEYMSDLIYTLTIYKKKFLL